MRVKFCGITSVDDAREAARLGAWAIGLNHHRDSPRFCEPTVAAAIGGALKRRLQIVGGVVKPPPGQLDAAPPDEAPPMGPLPRAEGAAVFPGGAPRPRRQAVQAAPGAS